VDKFVQFAAHRRQIAPSAFYEKGAVPFSVCSHTKQFEKTLIQAIRIEFPNLGNAIRQKVSLGSIMKRKDNEEIDDIADIVPKISPANVMIANNMAEEEVQHSSDKD